MTDVWRILKQNLLLILSIIIISVVSVGMVSYFLLKPVYEAKATLLVKKINLENSQIEVDDLIASEKLVKTYAEIAKSRLVLDKVIAQLNLNMTTDQLFEKIQVNADNETLMTTISVRDNDRAQAVLIANEIATVSLLTWNEIMQMENVLIIDEAKQEHTADPISPRPLLNIVVAFLLSAMASVGFVVLRELLDKTLKTEEEIEEKFAIPVLGVIPQLKQPKTK